MSIEKPRQLAESICRVWRGAAQRTSTSREAGKRLRYETLEPRLTLAAAGLVDVGSQPDGALSGKVVYTSGGHGSAAGSTGVWAYGRPLLNNMIEDLGNQDQLTFFADAAFRAGATVVPFRPIGHQTNEIVMDNDDAGVTFTGAWSNSTATTFFGSAGDVPYRYVTSSATETAVATYRPNITEAGFYPVYAWTRAGTDRAADQLYRVNHSGGSTEVTVNHRMVGTGLVYLGTYYFEAGTTGSVEISNRSSESGKTIIADMIRFGNGMGDIDRGAGVSGLSREDEASYYWIKWHVDHAQGISTSTYDSGSTLDSDKNVSAPTKYATYMNQAGEGSLSDRVYVGFHSNAGGGRGVVGLHNTSHGGDTPNQLLLATLLGQEVNDDLVDQNGLFEHTWNDRGSNITFETTFNYGEINNSTINNEFDATIVEVAFHDNQLDAELMRDADVRAATALATVQGLVKYFHSLDVTTPLVMAPGKVTKVAAKAAGSGSVTVSWVPPVANTYNGDAATGFMIYGSTNGYGFDGGTYVAGGSATSYTFTGLDPNEGAYYFKIVAVNAGGASMDSEVVAAMPNAGARDILIVNGFDRLSRQQNPVQSGAERVRPRQSNSYDYVTQVASAIEVANPDLVVDSASNEAVVSGAINLGDYKAVVWILGEESTDDDTFSTSEQTLVTNYLAAGGKLFVSGSEIGWDLDAQNNGRTFYNNQLHADYVSDDANTYNVSGVAGSIFAGLNFAFDNGSQFYDVNTPDVITTSGGSTAAMTYSTGTTAGIVYDGGVGGSKVVNLAFPFETITVASTRNEVLARVLDFFGFDLVLTDFDAILDNDDGPAVYTETGTWQTSGSTGYNGLTYRYAFSNTAATASWQFYAPFAGQGEVFVQYRNGSNRTTDTRYQIDTGNGVQNVSIDQTLNNLTWVSLGSFSFTAGSHSILLDAQTSTGGTVLIADAVRVVIPVPAPENADFNASGLVDGLDFLAWQRGFGTMGGATPGQGDANADGNVTAADLGIWQAQYGTAPAISAAVSAFQASGTLSDESEAPALQAAFGLLLDEAPQAGPTASESEQLVALEVVFDNAQSPWGLVDLLGPQATSSEAISSRVSAGLPNSDLIDSAFSDAELSLLEAAFPEAIR